MQKAKKLDTTFKENTGNTLSNSSLLNMFSLHEKESDKFLNIFRCYLLNSEIVNDAAYYDLYIVKNVDWLENIAFEFYDSPKLWWIVAITNEIYNPFEVLEEGDSLKIIKSEYLYQILKEVKQIGEY